MAHWLPKETLVDEVEFIPNPAEGIFDIVLTLLDGTKVRYKGCHFQGVEVYSPDPPTITAAEIWRR